MSHSMTDGIPTGWKAENGMHILTSTDDRTFPAFAGYDKLVVELFAGPGGMSTGLEFAGLNPRQVLGIEWDASACMTAVRAGHPRLHADLTLLDPRVFGTVWGLHGSPSCQGFSMAGKGESRGDTDLLLMAITAMGRRPDDADVIMAQLRDLAKSPLSSLSLEPLRYILALRPRWVTLEQVRAVLPLWEAYAVVLRELGYSVWTDVVHSEQYGVPQTRQRAVLLASLDLDVSGGMKPTHSKFHTHKSKRGQLDEGVLPYVTMAQALGWGMTERPYVTVAAGTKAGGVDPQALGGSQARAIVHGERAHGDWVEQPADHPRATLGGARVLNSDPKPQERTGDEPSFTVTGGGRNTGFEFTHQRSNYNTGSSSDDPAERDRGIRTLDEPSSTITTKGFQWATEEREPFTVRDGDDADEPAPTVHFGARLNEVKWATHMGDVRNAHGAVRSLEEPSATITSAMDNGNFQFVGKSRNDGVRVTVQEAGILQSFPADYPWTGTLTKQYEQAGNAVPPLLGQAMVETVLGIRATRKAA